MALNTLDILDVSQCACARLRKASRAVTQFYDRALKPSGLTPTQFTVLATLERTGAIAQAELAIALVMDRTTLIRTLKPLLAQGLVARQAAGARRKTTLALTAAGRQRYQLALPLWRAAQARLSDALGEAGWSGLAAGLDGAIDAVSTA